MRFTGVILVNNSYFTVLIIPLRLGQSKYIKDIKSDKSFRSMLLLCIASLKAVINKTINCDVNDFVLATPISGPACR